MVCCAIAKVTSNPTPTGAPTTKSEESRRQDRTTMSAAMAHESIEARVRSARILRSSSSRSTCAPVASVFTPGKSRATPALVSRTRVTRRWAKGRSAATPEGFTKRYSSLPSAGLRYSRTAAARGA